MLYRFDINFVKVGKKERWIKHESALNSDWTKAKIHCKQQLFVEDSCTRQERVTVIEKNDTAIAGER